MVECYRHVFGRVVRAINAIRHVGRVGQRLETMRAAGRDVERDLLVVTELEAFPVAVRRRHRPQVHDDVEDAAV
jgi:hypothetical protein